MLAGQCFIGRVGRWESVKVAFETWWWLAVQGCFCWIRRAVGFQPFLCKKRGEKSVVHDEELSLRADGVGFCWSRLEPSSAFKTDLEKTLRVSAPKTACTECSADELKKG